MEETVLIEQGRLRKGREEVKREIRGHTAFPRPSLSSGVTLVNTAAPGNQERCWRAAGETPEGLGEPEGAIRLG
jgi:hypothetical protein